METALSKKLNRGLTAEQHAGREGKLTASQIKTIMTGSASEIMNLYRFHIGDPGYVEEDLTQNWNVQRGNATEALNLHFYEIRTGRELKRIGEQVAMPGRPEYVATLDAFDDVEQMPIDAKDSGAHMKPYDLLERYAPQLHWQMMCTETKRSFLRPSIGAAEPVNLLMEFNADYAAQLLARADAYWECVKTLTAPVEIEAAPLPVPAEVLPIVLEEVDMSLSNSFAEQAAVWLECEPYNKKFDKAVKEIKEFVKPNHGRLYGHGIQIKRSKDNKLSITKNG